MSSSLQPFDFNGKRIRVFIDTDGIEWWIASDVCSALGYENSRKAIADHVDPDDKGYVDLNSGSVTPPVSKSYTPGLTAVINESGLYSLIIGSHMPDAKKFKRWVTSEVVPSIRKTGSYLPVTLSPAELILAQAQQLVDHERRVKTLEAETADHGDRIERIEARQTAVENGNEYFTVMGYFAYRHIPIDHNSAVSFGKRAASLSSIRGIKIGKVSDPRYGEVNSYHINVLNQVFKATKGSGQ